MRPPPSLSPDDAPDAIDVPRMDPPPASLEALVTKAGRTRHEPKSAPAWWFWLALALVTAAITAYVMR